MGPDTWLASPYHSAWTWLKHRWRDRKTTTPEVREGRRGTYVLPELGLPEGYEPPSAALNEWRSR